MEQNQFELIVSILGDLNVRIGVLETALLKEDSGLFENCREDINRLQNIIPRLG